MNILVNRKSAQDAHRAFVRAGAELQKGHSVVLFPEGTISREVPRLRPFKNGAFRLAIEQQVPLVPITFFNHYRLLRDAPYLQGICRPGLARIHVHTPIETAGMGPDQMESLKERVRGILTESLAQYPNTQPNLSV
jgi:1-acyl-sn-glycerol-3-phosphate acyltransferase